MQIDSEALRQRAFDRSTSDQSETDVTSTLRTELAPQRAPLNFIHTTVLNA